MTYSDIYFTPEFTKNHKNEIYRQEVQASWQSEGYTAVSDWTSSLCGVHANYMIEVAMIGVSRLESHGGEAVT